MRKRNEEQKKAVALSYDSSIHNAPEVVAKGTGETAELILKLAKDNDVPIQEDPSLLEMLSKLDINESIPEELYQAVAEVFAFIYSMDKKIDVK